MLTDKLLEGLTNQGAMGIVLAILLWLFVRFFNRSFDAQTERDRASTEFMRQCLSTLQDIKSACLSCRNEIMTSENNRLSFVGDKIVEAVRESEQKIIQENRREAEISRPFQTSPVPRQPYPPASGTRSTR